jgi:hypothetical protein
VMLTAINRTSKLLKVFLIMAGASAFGLPVNLYLHDLLIRFFPSEPFTFIMVFIILPIIFLAGVAGAIVIGVKQVVKSS